MIIPFSRARSISCAIRGFGLPAPPCFQSLFIPTLRFCGRRPRDHCVPSWRTDVLTPALPSYPPPAPRDHPSFCLEKDPPPTARAEAMVKRKTRPLDQSPWYRTSGLRAGSCLFFFIQQLPGFPPPPFFPRPLSFSPSLPEARLSKAVPPAPQSPQM